MTARSTLTLALAAALTVAVGGCGDELRPSQVAQIATVATPQDPPAELVPEFEGDEGLVKFTAAATKLCRDAVADGPLLPAEGADHHQVSRYVLDFDHSIHGLDAVIGTLVQQRPESAPQLKELRAAVGRVRAEARIVNQGTHVDPAPLRAAVQQLHAVALQVGLPTCAVN